MFGLGGAAVKKIGEVSRVGVAERSDADAKQAEFGAVGFTQQ